MNVASSWVDRKMDDHQGIDAIRCVMPHRFGFLILIDLGLRVWNYEIFKSAHLVTMFVNSWAALWEALTVRHWLLIGEEVGVFECQMN